MVKHLQPAAQLKGNDFVIGDLDGNPGDSLRITVKGPKAGWWKDFATGEGGRDPCKYWKAVRKIGESDHVTFFAEMASFSGQSFNYEPRGGPIDWQKCLDDFSSADADKLVRMRGLNPQFVRYLHDEVRGVGTRFGQIVFPVCGPGNVLTGLHRWCDDGTLKFTKGTKVQLLIFGDLVGPISKAHLHESRWDCYAQASATGWYKKPGVLFVSTLGAGNGRLIKGFLPPGTRVYCWEQHDLPGRNGKAPNEEWFRVVAENAGCDIYRVKVPSAYKDTNDLIRAENPSEASVALAVAVSEAEPYASAAPLDGSPTPASKLFPAPKERPSFRLYGNDFEEDGKNWEAGVYLHDYDERANNLIDTRILSPARVVAITRTAAGTEHGYLLEYVPHGKTAIRYEVIPQSLLVGHINDLMKALRGDLGMFAPYKYREVIRAYLDDEHQKFSAKRPQDFWESTKTSGWHQLGRCFVLPKKVLGEQNGVWFIVSGETAQYNCRGTLQDWNDNVAKYAKDNRYLIFSICCGFSGPLLGLLGVTGIGFHLFNDSTCGKTTVLLVGTSVWGAPEYMLVWRQTSNRLESQAASRSDTFLAIDELSMIDANSLDACLYLLPGGVAKGRLKRDSSAADTAHWRIPILSSGECAIETYLRAHKLQHKAGQMVRVCDLPVEAAHGIFDLVQGRPILVRPGLEIRHPGRESRQLRLACLVLRHRCEW
jgi:hypothetical protein